jgi:hypothetical protein
VPGAAPQISYRRSWFSLLGQARQQGPVLRLASKLVTEAGRLRLGDGVVAAANGMMLRDRAIHDYESVLLTSRPDGIRYHGRVMEPLP